jgi:hypothetical protein
MTPSVATNSNTSKDVTGPSTEVAGGKLPATPKWLDFLVGDTDGLPLRVFEVLFSITFLLWMGRNFTTWKEWLTEEGFHLNAPELTAMNYPLPFTLLPNWGVTLLAAAIGVSCVAHILNRWRRLALLTLFASAVYVQGVDLMAAFTLNKLYVGIYGVLLVTPGYTRDEMTGRLRVSAVAVRVIQATLILLYFASGLAKAFRGDWLKYGDVLYTQVQGVYRTDTAALMLRCSAPLKVGQVPVMFRRLVDGVGCIG